MEHCSGLLVPVIVALLIREMRFEEGSSGGILPADRCAGAVAVIIWRFIFDPDSGIANAFIQQFGIGHQLWLQDAALAKPSLVAIMTWERLALRR